MNKKGMAIGTVVIFFIGVIVALSLLPAIAEGQNTLTATISGENVTLAAGAVGTAVDMTGQELLNTPVVYNATDVLVPATNYTIAEGVSATTGLKTVQYTALDPVAASQNVNITYNYGLDGYADSQGARGMANLIVLFSAIGILGFSVFYAIGKFKGIF